MSRLLVCGDRNWSNEPWLRAVVHDTIDRLNVNTIIEGDANGADRMAGTFANEYPLEHWVFPAKWNDCFCSHTRVQHSKCELGLLCLFCQCMEFKKQGKAAGPLRNIEMLVQGKPDFCLAFHNCIANSSGTRDMINRCKSAGIHGELWSDRGLEEEW